MAEISQRESCKRWESATAEEAVKRTFRKDPKIRSELKEQLKILGLLDKPINGYSVQSLPKTREGGGISISYTDTFFEVEKETGDCHPIDYLYLLVEKAVSKGMNRSKITGMLSRGMRTFASLLRDRDFATVMKAEIDKEKLKFSVERDPIEDSQHHTDVLIKAGNQIFRIWLFQYSRMGIPHDVERITGQRGELIEGIHVLCPLKSEIAMEHGYLVNSVKINQKRLGNVSKKLKGLKKGTKAFEECLARQGRISKKLVELKAKEKTALSEIEDEVDVWHGWYFYSPKKVKQVLKLIRGINEGKTAPKEYAEVCKILNAHKKYLAEVSAFKI